MTAVVARAGAEPTSSRMTGTLLRTPTATMAAAMMAKERAPVGPLGVKV
jgi:hypothetical protein